MMRSLVMRRELRVRPTAVLCLILGACSVVEVVNQPLNSGGKHVTHILGVGALPNNKTTDFGEVRSQLTFVDKTLFLQYFLSKSRHIAVMAPEGVGKSTILDMVKRFCDVQVAEPKGAAAGGGSKAKRADPKTLFEGLAISKAKDEEGTPLMEHLSKYPVIYLDFDQLIMVTERAFFRSLREMIHSLYDFHKYLLESKAISDDLKATFKMFEDPKGHSLLQNEDYATGGKDLSEMLFKHYKHKCLVLIDNFDAPVTKFLGGASVDESADNIFRAIKNLVSGLIKKNTKHVSHSLLVGVSRLGTVYTRKTRDLEYISAFEDEKLSKFFGLTQHDVQTALTESGKSEKLEAVTHSYDWYRLAGTDEKLYNTRAILEYVASEKFAGPQRAEKYLSHMSHLFEYEKLGKELERNIMKNTTLMRKLTFSRKDIKIMRDLITNPEEAAPDKTTTHFFMQYLQELGFFVITSMNTYKNVVSIAMVSRDVEEDLKTILYTNRFFIDKFKMDEDHVFDYVKSLALLNDSDSKNFVTLANNMKNLFENVMPENEFEFRGPLVYLPKIHQGLMNEAVNPKRSNATYENVDVCTGRMTWPKWQRLDLAIYKKDTIMVFGYRFNRGTSNDALQEICDGHKFDITTRYGINGLNQQTMIGVSFDKHRVCKISYLTSELGINLEYAINVTAKEIRPF